MSTALTEPRKDKRSAASRAIAQAILDQYQPTSAKEMQNALEDRFGPMFEAILQGEMDDHLGYKSNGHGLKNTTNRCNACGSKRLKTSMDEVDFKTPCNQDGSFDPQLIPKRERDVSDIKEKVITIYAKEMSQRDIADAIKRYLCFLYKLFHADKLQDNIKDIL